MLNYRFLEQWLVDMVLKKMGQSFPRANPEARKAARRCATEIIRRLSPNECSFQSWFWWVWLCLRGGRSNARRCGSLILMSYGLQMEDQGGLQPQTWDLNSLSGH